MATIKPYTDLQQSKKLAEILLVESADMYYDRCGTPSFFSKYVTHQSIHNDKYNHLIPCWSLAALLDILSLYEINSRKGEIQLDAKGIALSTTNGETLLDLAINMIIELHEQNLL